MDSPPATNSGVYGQRDQYSAEGDFNAVSFVIKQALLQIKTITLVKVVKVSNAGGVAPAGLVDVQPLVNQMTGDRKAIPHGVVHGIPYARLQGGANAVILDPQVGDIGICAFASRDISTIKATRAQGNPGSLRTFDWADGLYLGGCLNGMPTQYVRFSTDGITLHSPAAVTLDAPTVRISAASLTIAASSATTITTPTFTVNGATVLNGNTSVAGSVTNNGKNIGSGHLHGGVARGNTTTDGPT